MNADTRQTLITRVAIPLIIFTILAVLTPYVGGNLLVPFATGAFIAGLVSLLTIPPTLHNLLIRIRIQQGYEAWRRTAFRIAVIGLVTFPTLFLTDAFLGFFVYGLLGSLSGGLGFCHCISALQNRNAPEAPGGSSSALLSGVSVSKGAPQLRQLEKKGEFAHGGFYEQYLVFSPCSRKLLTWDPQQVLLFKLEQTEPIGTITGSRVPVGFSSDSRHLFTTGNGKLERWSTEALAISVTPEAELHLAEGELSADGSWRAVMSVHGHQYVVNPETGFTAPIKLERPQEFNPYRIFYSDLSGQFLISMGSIAVLADAESMTVQWRSTDVGRSITAVGISPDQKVAAYCSMGGSVYVLDLQNQTPIGTFLVPGEIRCMAFSPDSQHLAVGCGDILSDVVVLNLTQGPVAVAKPGYGNNWAVAFSPDGTLLAVGSDDGKVSLWEW